MAKPKQKRDLPAPPVAPHLEKLPFAEMGWDAFEEFCCDLIAHLPGVRDCHRYGTQGDTQLGIDLFADFDSGERQAFQNRRWKQFGPKAVEKAVRATTYTAGRYIILLSRVATTKTRDAVDKYPKWGIWDLRDISRKVRELPLDSARQLLDHHFGAAVRRAFLGGSAVSTFPTEEAFFRPLLDSSKLFNHTWSLVGRATQLRQLHEFVESKENRIAILTGRGGIGKTKLLHAFAQDFEERYPQMALRFVVDGLPLTPESLDDLPMTACVIAVDDAHRREDLGVLLTYAQQRTQPIKLLFSSRLQGVDHLHYLLRQGGFDIQEVMKVDPVTELSREEVSQLAVQILGDDHKEYADRLAAATKDCPLVTVIGGRLLVEKQVDPQLLERDEDFRQVALSTFRDVLVGEVADRIDPEFCRSLLNVLAAIAPICPDNEQFRVAAAEFLGVEADRVADALGILEKHGVLLRRGYSVRITPDVLADHLLHDACLTPQGRHKGYAKRVFEKFASICVAQVFRNLAELDWRVHRATGEDTDLLAEIWRAVREEFEGAGNLARCTMPDLIKDIAYYQPGQILELVEFAYRNPANAPDPEWTTDLHPFSHDHVLRKLPEVIRRIAYSIRHLPRCCDLLWELGRDDGRDLNPYPDHPMRVLTDLAGYDFEKPSYYNRIVLEAAARWLKTPDAHAHLHTPLEVLDPLLAKTGTSVEGNQHGFVIRSFHCSKESTQLLRDGALNLVAGCLDSPMIRVVLRALRSMDEALHEPLQYHNLSISENDRAQWTPDRLRVLGILEEFVSRSLHPIILLRVQEILRNAAIYGSSKEVNQKARSIARAIPDSFDLRLTRLLSQSHNDFWLFGEDEQQISWQQQQERLKVMSREVAAQFMKRYPEPQDGFMSLNDRFREVAESGGEVHPWLLLHTLSEVDGAYSDRLCELVLASPECPMAFTFGTLVAKLRRRNERHALSLLRGAVQTGNTVLCRTVANEYGQQGWLAEPTSEDLDLFERLISHADFGVRRFAVFALPTLAKTQPRTAIALALKLDVVDSDKLTDDLCATFAKETNGIELGQLTDADLKGILAKLEAAQRIEGHFVQQFLAYASKRDPQAVIQLLLNRIENEEARRSESSRALPFDGFHFRLEGVVESEKYQDFLRTIRDRMVGASGPDRFWLPKLFKEISLNFSPPSLQVLGEWVDSGEREKIEAASYILSEAYHRFVFEEVAYVSPSY